jgi:tyrosyl-tRNA synthetase
MGLLDKGKKWVEEKYESAKQSYRNEREIRKAERLAYKREYEKNRAIERIEAAKRQGRRMAKKEASDMVKRGYGGSFSRVRSAWIRESKELGRMPMFANWSSPAQQRPITAKKKKKYNPMDMNTWW